MKVSLWRRNVKSSVLITFAAMLLLPSTSVFALKDSLVAETVVPDISTAVEQVESVGSSSASSPGSLPPPELVSSIESQSPVDQLQAEPTIPALEHVTQPMPAEVIVPAVPTKPSPVVPSDAILVSTVQITEGALDFIQLYNTDDSIVGAKDLSVAVLYHPAQPQDPTPSCEVEVNGYMLAASHLVIAKRGLTGDSIYPFEACSGVSAGTMTIELRRDSAMHAATNPDGVIERLYFENVGSTPTKQWTRKGFTSTRRSGDLAIDFSSGLPATSVLADSLYPVPAEPSLQVTEILPNPVACATADTRTTCTPYIRVVNDSDEIIDLSLYRLRGGSLGETPSVYNMSELSGKVAAHSSAIIHRDKYGKPLALDKSSGTVWFEDSFGVENYPNNITPYDKADTAALRGGVWTYDTTGLWKWVAATKGSDLVSPAAGMGSAGTDSLKPCTADQYRSPETNRCRAIDTAAILQACTVGEYRNPETNRCNKLASATSTLVPCESGEYRNPSTNRCNKIATSSSTLEPCNPGYERNPDTNRCRQVATAGAVSSKTDFPVESVKDSAKAFVGWWALGGLLILGAGYASWEWRRELAGAIKSIGTKFISSKGK